MATNTIPGARPRSLSPAAAASLGGRGKYHKNPGVTGVDTLVNFTGQFNAPGVDSSGNPQSTWPYAMIGNAPTSSKTTHIGAPLIPVSLDLRDYDGSPRYVGGQRLYYDGTQYGKPVLNSPVFQKTQWASSHSPTQYADAIHRAQFWSAGKNTPLDDGWHNLLDGHLATPRTMTLIRGTYRFRLNSDGSCCLYVLVDADAFGNALFPSAAPDMTTVIGAAEVSGDITTADLSTFLFPNTYLYLNGDPSECCVLGFHSLDYEPGDATNGNLIRFYVMNYSSWITPGLFGDAFADITAVSHEVAEAFSDPFVGIFGYNMTPWWLAPNGLCQNNLEVGDVIEGLPNATYPVTMNGYTYHPQNVAILPYFAFQSPSMAIGGAYSFPDPTVLTGPSARQPFNCGY